MNLVVEEVQVCAHFVVPAFLWLELDAFEDRGIFLFALLHGLLHVLVGLLGLVGSCHDGLCVALDVVLDDVAEHLDVEASGAVAFRNCGIQVAASVELVG